MPVPSHLYKYEILDPQRRPSLHPLNKDGRACRSRRPDNAGLGSNPSQPLRGLPLLAARGAWRTAPLGLGLLTPWAQQRRLRDLPRRQCDHLRVLQAHQGILHANNPASPVTRVNLPGTCGKCHAGPFAAFQKSRHYELVRGGNRERQRARRVTTRSPRTCCRRSNSRGVARAVMAPGRWRPTVTSRRRGA